MGAECAVLDWAASGAMALTGLPDGPVTLSAAPALALLGLVTDELARVTRATGREVRVDPAELIVGRAALAGLSRGGQVSAGGSSFLLRAADGWCAVTLSRPDDLESVPAIGGVLGVDVAPPGGAGPDPAGSASVDWARGVLARVALGTPAADFAAAAQLLGVPGAALPEALAEEAPGKPSGLSGSAGGWPPWRAERIAPPLAGAGLAGAVVVDLSSMWAGPLCGWLLGLAGAEVIKVESAGRPDGARGGNRDFFDWLHGGQRSVAVDFGSREGRAVLADLLAAADVVIEASRPRALAALGLAPGVIPHRDGQVWLSITGYGQAAPGQVAFGDDAAVAGGLVGWVDGGDRAGGRGGADTADGAGGPDETGWTGRRGETGGHRRAARNGGVWAEPVFCADAIADPLTGVCGALAVAESRAGGGGERIDVAMRDVAAAFARASIQEHGVHQVLADGSVRCPRSGRVQAVVAPRWPALLGEARAPELGADNAGVLAWLAD